MVLLMAAITLIVPIYKVERYIHKCIDSILIQSFQNFDLVLVDDGSPDTCPQICDDYAKKDPRITVIHKQNGGLSDARNAGIDWAMAHSDSEWLAFADSDDYLHPDYLKTLYELGVKESADLVICDFVRVNDREEILEDKHFFVNLVTENKELLFDYLRSDWHVVTAWNKLYQKQIFRELRFETGKIHEDSFAIHHVLWNCKRAAFVSVPLYYYRLRDDSIMTSESPRTKLDGLEAYVEQYEFGWKHRIASLTGGISLKYWCEVAEMRQSFDEHDEQRYQHLKKRLAEVYFRSPQNRKPRRVFSFYFPILYDRLSTCIMSK